MQRFNVFTIVGCLVAAGALIGVSCPVATANVLSNPGFELPDASGGDVYGSASWGAFNDAYTTQGTVPHAGAQTLKIFGPFFQFGGAGVVQGGFAAAEDDLWQASAWAKSDSSDPIDPQNFAVVKIEFLNNINTVIGFAESPQITTASLVPDVWKQFSVTAMAPANTASAQIVLVHVQLDNPPAGGSIFFDDASFAIVPEPASALLGGIALAALAWMSRRRTAQ